MVRYDYVIIKYIFRVCERLLDSREGGVEVKLSYFKFINVSVCILLIVIF